MKRFLSILTTILLLLSMSACSFSGKDENDASFYYCRKSYRYHQEDSVIAAESRSIGEKSNDIQQLLALYFIGPQSEELQAPFPANVKLVRAEKDGRSVTITLSGAEDILDTHSYTLGCACLAMTTFDLTRCASVTILCGENTITLTPGDLMLSDSPLLGVTTEDRI